MVINQNMVVWNQKHRKHRGGGGDFRYAVNFSIIAKKTRHSEIQIFAMHGNFRYDSEISLAYRKFVHSENFTRIAKFSLWLRNFRNPCEIFTMHSEIPGLPLLLLLCHCIFFLSIPLHILHFWLMKSL